MTNKLDMEAAARYEFSTDVDYIENYFAIFYSLGNDPQKKDPHKMEGLMFIACVGGSLEVMLDLRKYMLQKNDLLIVLPGQVIQVLAKSPDFDGRFIFMSNEFLTNISLRRRNFSTFLSSGTTRDQPASPGYGYVCGLSGFYPLAYAFVGAFLSAGYHPKLGRFHVFRIYVDGEIHGR